MTFKTIATYATYLQAAAPKSLLESEGIICYLRDEHSVTINPIYGGAYGYIKLDVAEGQFEEAKQ